MSRSTEMNTTKTNTVPAWPIVGIVLLFFATSASAETALPSAMFRLDGAVSGPILAQGAEATVTLTLDAGATATPEPLMLTRLALTDGDTQTSTVAYDPATTLVLDLPADTGRTGIHYVTARMPQSRRIRWTHYEVNPTTAPQTAGYESTATVALGLRDMSLWRLDLFFDEDTSGCWQANNPDADFHWIREDAYYAWSLFARGGPGDAERACATLRAFCAAQDKVLTSPTCGTFFTNGTDRRTPDSAVMAFSAPILMALLHRPPPGLDAATRDIMRESLRLAVDHQVMGWGFSPRYENFFLLGVATLATAGSVFDEPAHTERARERLRLFCDEVLPRGAPPEANSPVYTGVSLWALKLLAEGTTDPELLARAKTVSERLWLDSALFFHPGWRQWAGPFSRVYEDGLLGGAGITAFTVAAENGIPVLDAPWRVAEMAAANHGLDINPAGFLSSLGRSAPLELRACLAGRSVPSTVWQRGYYFDMTSALRPGLALGTSSDTFDIIGNEGFVLQVGDQVQPGGIAAVYARVGAAGGRVPNYATGVSFDIHSFQHDLRTILIADRTLPAGEPPDARALLALVADERFAQWNDTRVNGTPVSLPTELVGGDTFFARREGAFLAVKPLFAVPLGERLHSTVVERDSGQLALSLLALDASTSQALAGDRIEAAVAVACSPAGDWASFDAFVAEHLANSSAQTTSTAASHSIRWDYHGAMDCAFDRATRRFSSRYTDGTPLPAALADAPFASQPGASATTVRDLSVSGLPDNAWVVYPEGARFASVANPTTQSATLGCNWTSSPVNVAPWETARIRKPERTRLMINEVWVSGTGWAGDWVELVVLEDTAASQLEACSIGHSQPQTMDKAGSWRFASMASIAPVFKAGTIIVCAGGDVLPAEDLRYDFGSGDRVVQLRFGGGHLIGTDTGFGLETSDLAWVDTASSGPLVSAEGFSVCWSQSPGVLGEDAFVAASPPAVGGGVLRLTGALSERANPADWSTTGPPTRGAGNGGSNSTSIEALPVGLSWFVAD